MVDINKEIEKIEKNCLEIARKELNILKKENDEIAEEKILEKINLYKDELQKKYDIELNKLYREYNKNLFDYEMNEKKKINAFKETLINNIENKIKLEFEKFVNTFEYKEYLFKNIENALKKVTRNGCIIYITEKDYYKFKEDIANKFNINVDKIGNENIGGCKIVNLTDKISIDNTLKTNITEKVKKINI